ncbi:tyrosine-type recombinase/integrase [Fundidesulfovibrio terrae]|uniref:tyrosine-type recombinase/integrase n=1 Tax=Fundidesulfovibrio terrae TaxID=2922866 RepID=UPI001FAED3D1|nr:site-specific integrase [Fundidesulfovibrio terrae]
MSLSTRTNGYYCQLLIYGNRFNFLIHTQDATAASIVEKTVKHHARQMLEQGASVESVELYIKSVVAEFVKPKKMAEPKTVSIKTKGLTFKEAADKAFNKHFSRLGTPYHYRTHLNYLEEAARKVLKNNTPYLSDMTAPVISDMRDQLVKDRGISQMTANRYMATLRKMLNIMHRELNAISSVPYVKMASEVGGRLRVISKEEEQAFVAHALSKGTETYRIVSELFLFLLDTGLRLGEALYLTYSDNIDYGGNAIILRDPSKIKNKKPRNIPLTKRVREILQRRQGEYPDRPFPLTHHRAEMYMRYIKRDLKIDDIEFCYHACRHTFASRLVDKGVDLYRIQKLLGHKSIKTTEKYAHLNTDVLQSAVDALN